MKTVNVHEAKTHLSRLLAAVARGEEIVISRAGTPIAKLVPLRRGGLGHVLGVDRDRVEISADFDAPLPGDFLGSFEGEDTA